jgi:hypothetical protein
MTRGKGRARWRCKPCGKIAYGSMSRAHETIDHFALSPVHPVRVYPCPRGNGFHVTKQEASS